jgi:hypothetical protein
MKTRFLLKSVLAIFFCSATFAALAQNAYPTMTFGELTHNFGKINEVDGPATFTFEFTNTGAEPIVIQDVHASCGCTTPEWSNKPVLAGQKGMIKAQYNPAGRPGAFNKSITVTSNAVNSPVVLTISGDVVTKPATLADEYRYEMNGLRLKSTNVHMGDVLSNSKTTQTIEIVNDSQNEINIGFNEKRSTPECIKISSEPAVLKPQQKGVITVQYDASLKKDWGYVFDRIYVNVNGSSDSKHLITVSATIQEVFTDEQLKNPPVMTLSDGSSFNFGTLKQGESVHHEFKFKNTGKTDLIIRKTKASCGCTAIAPQDNVIKPGQESLIKTTFNSSGKSGRQNKSITITTNIPSNPTVVLNVEGEVIVPTNVENNTNTNSPK